MQAGWSLFHVQDLRHEVAIAADGEAHDCAYKRALEEGLVVPLLQHDAPHLDPDDVAQLCVLRVIQLRTSQARVSPMQHCAGPVSWLRVSPLPRVPTKLAGLARPPGPRG